MSVARSHSGKKGLSLLFIHQSFPSQYEFIARHYAADPENIVVAIGQVGRVSPLSGVRTLLYDFPEEMAELNPHTHPYSQRFGVDVCRGRLVARLLASLREQGFSPDVICVHPIWGEGLFIRTVYPDTPLLVYAEWYFDLSAPNYHFDPEFPLSGDQLCSTQAACACTAVSFASATCLQTPTRFQLQMLPFAFHDRTTLVHDGVDTQYFVPSASAKLLLPPTGEVVSSVFAPLPDWIPPRREERVLTRADTVVTFINRTLEPYRGWHQYARALPLIQQACPEAHFVIVGGTSDAAYGLPPPQGENWRDVFLKEVRHRVDWSRVHFLGWVPLGTVRDLLCVSRAHVYLTYPFVLGWSAINAMSCAAPIVFSDTPPCREVAEHEKTALLADFHSPVAIAEAVLRLINDPALAERLGQNARRHAVRHYDLDSVCLPRLVRAINTLAQGKMPRPFR
jgi:glycosyltransferase involved in cell wall biosynthesis